MGNCEETITWGVAKVTIRLFNIKLSEKFETILRPIEYNKGFRFELFIILPIIELLKPDKWIPEELICAIEFIPP